jgi:galactonate dehydratase
LQEYPIGEHEPPKSEIVRSTLQTENGFIIVPDAPGIGVELAEDAAERHPYRPRDVRARQHVDGSIIDQ